MTAFRRPLSGNALKILASIFMTLDHMGLMLFPRILLFRILGRLALPIFAYMIAEGCKYTRNKKKYLGMVLGLGTVCQIVYWFVDHDLYFSILFTFSLAILTIYAMQNWKEKQNLLSGLLFAAAIAAVYGLNRIFEIDYGFWGCMLPVFAAIPHKTRRDHYPVSILTLGLGLLLLSMDIGDIQIYSLLALPLLLAYSGQRGSWNLKYFFYIFYPAHLVILEAIALLIR